MVRLGDAWPQVWDDVVQEMEHALEEFDFQGEDIMLDWRIHANRRKFDRELFERYGMFKDIILHPKFQMTKLFLEENVDMNLLVGDPIMPITTAVIILFMLNKRVSYNILTLVAAYIFNVNPFYVSVAFIVLMFGSIAAKPKKFQQRKSGKPADATSYVPEKIGDLNVSPDKEYDHVLIGNNISCLYAAALLSKNGHRCCVLQPKDGPRLQVYPEGAPCASPLCNDSIGRVDRYQALLDMAQPAKADRVTFDPIGSEHNGYTSTIISMKRKTKTIGKKVLVAGGKRRMGGFVCLRAGEHTLAYDIAGKIPVDKSAIVSFFQSIKDVLQHNTSYLISKIVSVADFEKTSLEKNDPYKAFIALASSSVEEVIRKTGAENDEFAASLAAIAAVDATESILSENCSAYHLANAIQSAEMGLYYPQGGAIALQNALCKTIRASGGCVLSNVDVRGLVFEEDDVSADKAAEDSLRALGVNIALREDNKQNITQVLGKQSVVSGLGAISTYIKLIPGENIAKNVKESLSSVIEARPIVKVLFWLDGTAEELGISSTDYVEIPENIIDILDGSIDQEVRRTVAQKSVRIWSPSVKDSKWNKRLQVVVVELEAVDPIVEQKQCKFEDGSIGPTIYCCNSSEGSITDPGNSGFISSLGHRLVFSKGRMEKFRLFALNKLIEVYPLTRNKEIFVHVEPPTLGGHNMSSTKAKFTAKLGAVTNVSNLYLTGPDISTTRGLSGEIQSGWITANAVLGYSIPELDANRNIVADLRRANL